MEVCEYVNSSIVPFLLGSGKLAGKVTVAESHPKESVTVLKKVMSLFYT